MSSEYDLLFKLLLIGDSNVGKSCLMNRFSIGEFSHSGIATIGIDFKIKTIECLGKSIKLQIWDTAGTERFESVTSSFYKTSHGILILYDMTNQVSFNNIQNWLRRTDRYASEGVSKFLVGMKCDLVDKRVVAYETAKDLADSLGMDGFMEVSAQNNINVDECFWMVVVCLLSRYEAETPLHIACGKGQKEAVARLLDEKADLEAQGFNGKNPLHLACENGHKDVVSLLLAKKPNLEAITPSGRTPLHIACENGHQDVVSLLLAKKANLDATDSNGRTPLQYARDNGHKDVVSLLLAKKPKTNHEMDDHDHKFNIVIVGDELAGKSSLLSQYVEGSFSSFTTPTIGIDMKKKLIQFQREKILLHLWDTQGNRRFNSTTHIAYKPAHGFLVVYNICEKWSPSYYEALLGDINRLGGKEKPKLLVGSKLDLAEEEGQRKVSYKEGMDFAEKNGMGFIEVSSKDGTKVEECFQEMISRVYHFSLNGNLREDMKEACRMGRSDTAGDIVVSFPEVIHQRDENGRTPLHLVCENGAKDVVFLLLAKKAALEAMDLNQRSPLYIACENGREDVVSLLLAKKADSGARDLNGRTPLHIACKNGHQDVVSLLLASKADLEVTDLNQETPLHIACKSGRKDIVALLVANNANLEARDSNQRTPLYVACESGQEDVVSLLWAGSAELESKELEQKTKSDFDILLFRACKEGDSRMIEKIFSLYSKDVNIQFDLSKKTPLHVAAENGHRQVIFLLLRNNPSLELRDRDGAKPSDLKIVQDCIEMKNRYGGSLKKFSEEIDQQPHKILNRYHQIQRHLKVPKSQPPPSFHSALTSVVHTQKRQQAIGLPLLSENDIEEMIGVCKAFLAHKTQVSSQIQQVINLVTHDEALAIVCYCWEVPYFIPFRFNEWLHFASERDERERREGKEGKEGKEGMDGYLKLLEGGLKKLSKNLKTNVKVEGMEEEVGCIWLGELLFDLKEQEGIVFPFSRCFYKKTRTWKLIKTDHGYVPSIPLHLSSPSYSTPSSL